MASAIQIVECPRDAMQGWPTIISSADKKAYISKLLQCGFHTLDCLSFVSPKAVPQMADSHVVAAAIASVDAATQKLAIVLNERGATEACQYDHVDVLGYPFSISPTFQSKNGNSTIDESIQRLQHIVNIAQEHNKDVVVYISMAFGNPYGDEYDKDMVGDFISRIAALGVNTFSLADTVGVAQPADVYDLCNVLIPVLQTLSFGVHLHSTPALAEKKIEAAWRAGCKRFDVAVGGYGGCPMAGNELVGNINTAQLIAFCNKEGIPHGVDMHSLHEAQSIAGKIFTN